MMLPPPCFTVVRVPGLLQTWCFAFRPKSSILVSSDHRILFFMVSVFQCLLANSKQAVMCLLLWGVASVWPLYHKGRDGCPSGRISHLHRGTLELCQSDHQVFGHLPDLMAWLLLWNALSTMGLLYRQVCAFPNHVQPIEFTKGGIQSSCRNIKDDQWKQDALVLNSYVNYVSVFI